MDAYDAKPGSAIIIDGVACIVRSNDISKSGKHGASKCRIEAIGVFDGKKRVIAVPGHERFDVPMIEKRKAQAMSVNAEKKIATIMDSESFETLDVEIAEEIKEDIKEGSNVEYWTIGNEKKIMRTS